jgi:hypothetical protein
MLTASESHVESSLYPMRTHFPYFLWTPIKAEAESALIIRIKAQGNKPSRATRGPGYLARGWKKRLYAIRASSKLARDTRRVTHNGVEES